MKAVSSLYINTCISDWLTNDCWFSLFSFPVNNSTVIGIGFDILEPTFDHFSSVQFSSTFFGQTVNIIAYFYWLESIQKSVFFLSK